MPFIDWFCNLDCFILDQDVNYDAGGILLMHIRVRIDEETKSFWILGKKMTTTFFRRKYYTLNKRALLYTISPKALCALERLGTSVNPSASQ